MENRKVWFITGASKGLGLSLVKQLLDQGQIVAATSRNAYELTQAVGRGGPDFLPIQMHLSDESSVAHAIQMTLSTFKRIDVVVNNAGYGLGGAVEEVSDQEARTQFDVNVFGLMNVIRQVLPHLRSRRSGHIINIASIAGIAPGLGFGVYAASKYAVVGLSDVLAQELKPLGIHVTVVAPGGFRTNFLNADSLVISPNTLPDYEAVRALHQRFHDMNGQQAGDPEKAVSQMIELTRQPEPPVYLLLGSDAYTRAMQKMEQLQHSFLASEALSRSTDYNA